MEKSEQNITDVRGRIRRHGDVEEIHKDILNKYELSSEHYQALGKVFKDRWRTELEKGEKSQASTLLNKAIEAYMCGFNADIHKPSASSGLNAAILMELKEPPDPRREQIIPIIAYIFEQCISSGKPQYFDYAALLELAVLAKDKKRAKEILNNVVAAAQEPWELHITAHNLHLICDARELRQEMVQWIKEIEEVLIVSSVEKK